MSKYFCECGDNQEVIHRTKGEILEKESKDDHTIWEVICNNCDDTLFMNIDYIRYLKRTYDGEY